MQTVQSATSDLRVSVRHEFEVAPADALFNQDFVSVITGRSPRWLEHARHAGYGPLYVRMGGRFSKNKRGVVQIYGGRALYRKADVLAWLDAQPRFRDTSEHRMVASCA